MQICRLQRDIVKAVWSGRGCQNISEFNGVVQDCMQQLNQWSRSMYRGSIRGAIARIEREIQILANRNDGRSLSEIREKEKELENLLEDDEIYWKQRAREEWLQWGDRNTKWFHMKANNRRKRNKIRGLMDDLGIWTEEDSGMETIDNQYFLKLFQSFEPQIEAIEQILDTIPPGNRRAEFRISKVLLP